jgi:hypothetical protein
MSTVTAQNRMQLLQSILRTYNECLGDYSRSALEQFVRTWQRLLQRGSGQGKAGASHQQRVLLNSDMLLELAYTAYFCIYNGFQVGGGQMVELIRQRGASLASPVVLLTVNAIRTLSLNSGPSQQAMTTAISTPNQIAKNMITNASFRAKKIGDDIPKVVQLPANSDAEAAAMVNNLKALANMAKINEEVIEELIEKPSSANAVSNNTKNAKENDSSKLSKEKIKAKLPNLHVSGLRKKLSESERDGDKSKSTSEQKQRADKKSESETKKKKDKTSVTYRKDGEVVVASAASLTGSSTPPATSSASSAPAMVLSTPTAPTSLQSVTAHNGSAAEINSMEQIEALIQMRRLPAETVTIHSPESGTTIF